MRNPFAARTVSEMRHSLLQAAEATRIEYQAQAEYSQAMVTMLDKRITRLKAETMEDLRATTTEKRRVTDTALPTLHPTEIPPVIRKP